MGIDRVYEAERNENMSNLGGLGRGNEHIYITHVPGKKKPVLCIGNGYVIQPIASFSSEEYAEGFYKLLLKWFGLQKEEETE